MTLSKTNSSFFVKKFWILCACANNKMNKSEKIDIEMCTCTITENKLRSSAHSSLLKLLLSQNSGIDDDWHRNN